MEEVEEAVEGQRSKQAGITQKDLPLSLIYRNMYHTTCWGACLCPAGSFTLTSITPLLQGLLSCGPPGGSLIKTRC